MLWKIIIQCTPITKEFFINGSIQNILPAGISCPVPTLSISDAQVYIC